MGARAEGAAAPSRPSRGLLSPWAPARWAAAWAMSAGALTHAGTGDAAGAAFTVMPLFGTNMVLQASGDQSKTGPVAWGTAPAGAKVTVTRCNGGSVTGCGPSAPGSDVVSAAADATGKWTVSLPAAAETGPTEYTLAAGCSSGCGASASASGPFDAYNVSYGDVILCSGQSNMALTLEPIYNSQEIIAEAHHPEIRLFAVPDGSSAVPRTTLPGSAAGWQQTTPATVPQFSAVCYLTALNLQRLRAPAPGSPRSVLGLIKSAVGSTDVQSWMSAEAREAARTTCWAEGGEAPPASLPPSASHNPVVNDSATELYNAMIAPLYPYNISAMLWDQGENNVHYCSTHQYNCLWVSMVADWRARWQATPEAMPVVAVQLGGYAGGGNVSVIRVAQSDALPSGVAFWSNHSATRVPVSNSGVAATYDLLSPQPPPVPQGPTLTPWIHCRNKSEVGRRVALALHALQAARQGQGQPPGPETVGPVVVSARVVLGVEDKRPRVHITLDAGEGLTLGPVQRCVLCCNQTAAGPNELYAPFRLANHRGVWLAATGEVVNATTVVVTPVNVVPNDWVAAVRYEIVDVPQCALYNAAGLPALPFSLPVPWDARA